MATDPVPEPLTNQEVREKQRAQVGSEATTLPRDVAQMPTALPPAEESRSSNPKLNEAARSIGRASGQASSRVRELPQRVRDLKTEAQSSGPGKVEEIKSRVSDAAQQAKQSVSAAYDQTKEKTVAGYQQARGRALDMIREMKLRSRRIVHEYPLHVIAAATAAGFVAGVLLRIWRSNRDE